MKRNSYFNEKTENNIQKMIDEKLINERKLSDEEKLKIIDLKKAKVVEKIIYQ